MKILVGNTPAPEGIAAFDFAINHTRLVDAQLTVVDTGRNGDYSDPVYARAPDLDAIEAELGQAGLTYEIRRPNYGLSATDSILGIAEQVEAVLLNADIPVVCVPPKPEAG